MIDIHFNLDAKRTDREKREKFRAELTLDLQRNGEWGRKFSKSVSSNKYFASLFCFSGKARPACVYCERQPDV